MDGVTQKCRTILLVILQKLRALWNNGHISRGAIIFALHCAFRIIQVKIYRKYHSLPHGPYGVNVFGCAFYQKYYGGFEWYRYIGEYGKVVSYQQLQKTFFLINDPFIARKLYNLPLLANRFEPYLGSNVVNTITFLNGPKWKKRRKNIHSNLLTIINSQFVTHGSVNFLKTVLFPHLENEYISKRKSVTCLISDIFRPVTFNLVYFACFGKSIKSLDDIFWQNYNEQASLFWNCWMKRMANGLLFGEQNEKFAKQFTPYSEKIRHKMVKLVETNVEKNGYVDGSFYDKMMKNKEDKLSKTEILSDISSLLFPSIDTTANTAAFCILLLCKYTDIQQRLYDELMSVFSCIEDIDLSQKNLSRLTYFRAYIHEILRLYPVAETSAPHFLKDFSDSNVDKVKVNVDNKEYFIKKGQIFYVNSVSISRQCEYWIHDWNKKHFKGMNLEKVNMDEIHFNFWIDNDGKFRHNKSLSTFSFGMRECVGKQVAIKNLYVIIASMIISYKFSVLDKNFKIRLIGKPLLHPGIEPMIIETRNRVQNDQNEQ